jgi:glutaredoxin-like protein
MPLIPEQDQAELKRRFKKELKKDVTINLFVSRPSLLAVPGRECPTCPQTQELMEDLAALSPKLHLNTYDFFTQTKERDEYVVERVPAIVLESDGSPRLRYFGIPAGYEFATLLEDIETLSREVSPLSVETRKQLRKVNQPVHIQVFVTPT